MKNNVKTLTEIIIELNNRKTELENQEEHLLMQIRSLERKLDWNEKEQRDVKTTINFTALLDITMNRRKRNEHEILRL